MNRESYPASLFPLCGDLSAEAGATTVEVIGLQNIPIAPNPLTEWAVLTNRPSNGDLEWITPVLNGGNITISTLIPGDVLVWNGSTWVNATPPSGILLETSGVANGSQSELNLVAGSNITLTDNGFGSVTIDATGGGGAFVKISETILGSDTATVSFSAIAGTYRNLKLVITGRSSSGSDFYLQFNGDNGSNYDDYYSYNGGTGSGYATNLPHWGSVAPNAAPTHQAGSTDLMIFDYARTAWYKNILSIAARKDLATTGYILEFGGTWNSTAAITAIVVGLCDGSNFKTGTVLTLYGIN